MTWDFTVASRDSLSGRALATRDDALLRIGDDTPGDPIDGDESGDDTPEDGVVDGDAPEFVITGVSDPAGNILRQVDGELTNVPCYLDSPDCAPGSKFTFGPGEDDPTLAPTSFADDDGAGSGTGVKFRCIIPESVDSGTEVDQAIPGTYGHGLLGLYTQVNGQARLANQHNGIWCATNWAGFSGRRHRPGRRLAGEPLQLQQARRPHAAGLRQLPLPGPGAAASGRVQQRRRLQGGRRREHHARPGRVGDRHLEPLLRGDQPGRDHGRRPDGALARHQALGPERERDELLHAAAAQRRLRRVRRGAGRRALRQLPERAGAAADPVADPAALGPRRDATATPTT